MLVQGSVVERGVEEQSIQAGVVAVYHTLVDFTS